ncbi:MAG: hypothetical protein LBD25_03195 [Coriobacteriales bacterium]|jgi:hypothetical protein|nr:hypothetical protein [Coriobacteriales bacterium]
MKKDLKQRVMLLCGAGALALSIVLGAVAAVIGLAGAATEAATDFALGAACGASLAVGAALLVLGRNAPAPVSSEGLMPEERDALVQQRARGAALSLAGVLDALCVFLFVLFSLDLAALLLACALAVTAVFYLAYLTVLKRKA